MGGLLKGIMGRVVILRHTAVRLVADRSVLGKNIGYTPSYIQPGTWRGLSQGKVDAAGFYFRILDWKRIISTFFVTLPERKRKAICERVCEP